MQTTELLQPDYTKHRRTIWQCKPVTIEQYCICTLHNHVMHRLLPP